MAESKFIPITEHPAGIPELARCGRVDPYLDTPPGHEPFLPAPQHCGKRAVVIEEIQRTDPGTGVLWTYQLFYCEEHDPRQIRAQVAPGEPLV